MESNDEIMQDIIEDFVSRGQADDALWPYFADAAKDRMAVLEGEKGSKSVPQKSKVHIDSDEEEAESSGVGDMSHLFHSHSDLSSDEDEDTPLCAYCDEPLPLTPTQQLKDMAAALQLVSIPNPIPGNSSHRKTSSFTVTLDYCARHRVERDELPLARLENWPEDPDFAGLYDRVFRLQPRLQLLFDIEVLKCNTFFIAG